MPRQANEFEGLSQIKRARVTFNSCHLLSTGTSAGDIQHCSSWIEPNNAAPFHQLNGEFTSATAQIKDRAGVAGK